MKINKVFTTFLVLAILVFSCKTSKVDTQDKSNKVETPDKTDKVDTQAKASKEDGQGIRGQVFWIEGNQMPLVNKNGQNPVQEEKTTVKRIIKIHALTHINQARLGDALFGDIETTLVAEVETDEKGRFSVRLPAGKYSIFTVEETGHFANVFDLDSYVNPYEVNEGEWTKAEILIDYQGAY